jgi:hypothetical protein
MDALRLILENYTGSCAVTERLRLRSPRQRKRDVRLHCEHSQGYKPKCTQNLVCQKPSRLTRIKWLVPQPGQINPFGLRSDPGLYGRDFKVCRPLQPLNSIAVWMIFQPCLA